MFVTESVRAEHGVHPVLIPSRLSVGANLTRCGVDDFVPLVVLERVVVFTTQFVAEGVIRVGGLEYSLNEKTGRAYFDWTRFSKPRRHNYQRLSADCLIDGVRVSLCLASRVGDNRYGNENCFFTNGSLHKLSNINVRGNTNRLERPFFFRGGTSAVSIEFKPFTVGGKAMLARMGSTAVIFGRLYGEINHVELGKPLVLDNAQAHLIFTEF